MEIEIHLYYKYIINVKFYLFFNQPRIYQGPQKAEELNKFIVQDVLKGSRQEFTMSQELELGFWESDYFVQDSGLALAFHAVFKIVKMSSIDVLTVQPSQEKEVSCLNDDGKPIELFFSFQNSNIKYQLLVILLIHIQAEQYISSMAFQKLSFKFNFHLLSKLHLFLIKKLTLMPNTSLFLN